MRALGIKKFIGASYSALQNKIVIDYMTEAGFKVVSMEPIDVPFNEAQHISPERLYAHIKKLFRENKGADGIYIQGGAWHTESIVELLEQDLQVPVVHANIAPAWGAQELRAYVTRPGVSYWLGAAAHPVRPGIRRRHSGRDDL